MNVTDLRLYVIRPVCQHLELWSDAAENLVLGTALVESGGEHLAQVKGPALGLWQVEPATHDDLWRNYLAYRPKLADKMHELETAAALTAGALELVGNLYYAAGVCRLIYLRRAPRDLPADALGMATLWKHAYNTERGAGTVERALPMFEQACST
jgi:hypothetical protein